MKITKVAVQFVLDRGNIPLLVCPKCDEVLEEEIMGEKCPACQSWTYYYQCRIRFYDLVKKLIKKESFANSEVSAQ